MTTRLFRHGGDARGIKVVWHLASSGAEAVKFHGLVTEADDLAGAVCELLKIDTLAGPTICVGLHLPSDLPFHKVIDGLVLLC